MRAASFGLASVLLGLGLSVVACGDDSGGGGGSDGSGGATATSSGTDATTTSVGAGGDGTTSTTGAGGDAPECDPPGSVETDPLPRGFESVQATVLDLDGDPIAGDAIQVCGIDLCLTGDTNEDGFVVVSHDGTPLDAPIFKAGDGLLLAKIGFPLPAGEPVVLTATTFGLADSGTAMAAGASAEADGVVLAIAEDGAVGFNLLEFGGSGEDTFRASVVPPELIEDVAAGEGFVALVGLGPNETFLCPPAGLAIPNDAGLAAGTPVEFVQQGLETAQYFTLYGQWGQIALGHVSDDGSTIATDDGEGIPILSAVGVRPLD